MFTPTLAERDNNVTNQNDEPPVISFVREFLRTFRPSAKPTQDSIDSGWPWIHSGAHLFPTRTERVEFREALNRLHREFGGREDISSAALERALRSAVFHVADLSSKREPKRKDRIRHAATELEAFIHRPPRDFIVGIEVRGIDPDTLPFEFGRVRFERMSDAHARITEGQGSGVTAESVASGPESSNEACGNHDAIIGSLAIRARDHKAAENLSEREVRATVECLNLFLRNVPSFSSPLYVLTERTGASFFDRLIWDPDERDHSYSHASIHDLYSIESVRERQGYALDRVQQLLRREARTDVEELLLQGARWGGRALAAHSAEDAISFAFTALECVLVPCGKDEIIQRLALRVGWAASDAETTREAIATQTKKTYDLRSRIVHDGRIEIPASDRDRVTGIMELVLLKFLTNLDVDELAAAQDLERYLAQETSEPESDS